jgi:Entner-Doudoroff aldolase
MVPVDFATVFARCAVMAILRGHGPERTVELARTAWDLGIACVEVPVQSPQTREALAATVRAAQGRDVVVGAGTVTSPERVRESLAAGAAFTVAPGVDETVARASLDAGLAHLPGVATASDIQRALALGLTWLKAFPAAQLTPAWLAAMRGPFPEVSFVATGGVDSRNARAFLDAGAGAVAVGGALERPDELPALARLATG